jgi:hypothetical protein
LLVSCMAWLWLQDIWHKVVVVFLEPCAFVLLILES